jgi:hypothetical protein
MSDREAWREASVIQDPEDTRCWSRSPGDDSRCDLREGHDTRYGHESYRLGPGNEILSVDAAWADDEAADHPVMPVSESGVEPWAECSFCGIPTSPDGTRHQGR